MLLQDILRPKPKNENARPAGLGDFKFPTATEERVIPLVWGTVKLEGPNVVWYGDLRQTAITEKIKTGMFSSDKITTGYLYYIGIQFGLCVGTLDNVRRVWIGDNEVWSGEVSSGTIEIDELNLFGGHKLGQGGVKGFLRVHTGSSSQTVNTYLSEYQQISGTTPSYRGMCHMVWEGGYVGTSTSIKPFSFEVRRIPTGPSAATLAVNNGNDANLAFVAYEVLTNSDWGLSFPAADIDETSFTAAATTLQTEGNGFSFVLDQTMSLESLIEELQRQMDGVIYLNQFTGKWTIKLARYDYAPSSLAIADESNIIDIKNPTRGSWHDTVNYVTTQFTNRNDSYKGTYGLAQDLANVRIQGSVEKTNVVFPGVMDATLANNLAWRELRATSYPLVKATIRVNREFYGLVPGDVIKWSNAALDVSELIMRVRRIDLGELVNGQITLEIIQDVYATTDPSFGDPPTTEWTKPVNTPVAIPVAESIIIEAPYGVSIRDSDAITIGMPFRVWGGGRHQGKGEVEFDLRTVKTGIYETEQTIDQFMLIGKLTSSLGKATTSGSFDITPDPDNQSDLLRYLSAVTSSVLGDNLTNLIMVGSEFMLVTSGAANGNDITLTTVYRGVLDSAPASHNINSSVYLLSSGGGIGTKSWEMSDTIFVKLITRTDSSELGEGSATPVTVIMQGKHLRPNPPIGINVDGTGEYTSSTKDLDANYTGNNYDDAKLEVTFRRRDYTEFSENARQISGDAAPSNTTTYYRVRVFDDNPTELYVTDWNAGTNEVIVERTKVLRYTGGTIPSGLTLEIETKHTLDTIDYEALQSADDTITVSSNELSNDFNMGVLASSAVGNSWSAPVTGTYTFYLGTAFSTGAVQARINGGTWADVITVTNTTGTLVGVTAADTVEVRTNGGLVVNGRTETILIVDAPSGTVDAYAIFRE